MDALTLCLTQAAAKFVEQSINKGADFCEHFF